MIGVEIFMYNVVGPNEEVDYIIIPDGEQWEIQDWWGSANPNRDTHVCIIWDYGGVEEEILSVTHTSEKRVIGRTLIGDGLKKLAISLRNDTALTTETLGAGYSYKVL